MRAFQFIILQTPNTNMSHIIHNSWCLINVDSILHLAGWGWEGRRTGRHEIGRSTHLSQPLKPLKSPPLFESTTLFPENLKPAQFRTSIDRQRRLEHSYEIPGKLMLLLINVKSQFPRSLKSFMSCFIKPLYLMYSLCATKQGLFLAM